MKSNIAEINQSFIEHIDSLSETLPLAMAINQHVNKSAAKSYEEFKDSHVKYDDINGEEVMLVDYEHVHKYRRLSRRLKNTNIAQK